MSQKIGRNDPCPCGSGKKYKTCCLKMPTGKKKLTAKMLNQPKATDLMERTFGSRISKIGSGTPNALPPPASVGEGPDFLKGE